MTKRRGTAKPGDHAMRFLPTRCNEQTRTWLSLISCILTLCILFSPLKVYAQGGTQVKGSTREVTAVPNGTVDAGPVQLKKDSDNDGMSDEAETATGPILTILRTPIPMLTAMDFRMATKWRWDPVLITPTAMAMVSLTETRPAWVLTQMTPLIRHRPTQRSSASRSRLPRST